MSANIHMVHIITRVFETCDGYYDAEDIEINYELPYEIYLEILTDCVLEQFNTDNDIKFDRATVKEMIYQDVLDESYVSDLLETYSEVFYKAYKRLNKD